VHAAALGSLPQDTTGELRLVQDRVALLGKVTFFISGTFLIAVALADHLRHFQRVQLTGRLSHALGTLIASIALYVGKEVTNQSAIAFIVTAIVGAIILLAGVAGAALGDFGTVLAVLFAILVVVTGVLFARTQGSRGR
jgi:hypothetical protein